MSKLEKYKTFNELKNSVESSSVSDKRIAYLAADLDDFVSKVSETKIRRVSNGADPKA